MNLEPNELKAEAFNIISEAMTKWIYDMENPNEGINWIDGVITLTHHLVKKVEKGNHK